LEGHEAREGLRGVVGLVIGALALLLLLAPGVGEGGGENAVGGGGFGDGEGLGDYGRREVDAMGF
jgi:hypothetical protein